MRKASLYFKEGSSDKEYHAQLEKSGDGYVVNFQYGRRGAALTSGVKTPKPVPLAKAETTFDKLVAEKKAKGYTEGEDGTPYVGTCKETRVTGMLPQLLNPVEEGKVEEYLDDPAWSAQEKIDGKHILIRCDESEVVASNRKGLQVGIPEPVITALGANGVRGILDGEMVGDVYHAFDMLKEKSHGLMADPYLYRHSVLRATIMIPLPAVKVVPLFMLKRDKRELYARLKQEGKEGIVFKRLAAPYKPGRPNSGGDMLKFKFCSTCTCIVSHWGREGKRSIALEMVEIKGTPDATVFIPVRVGNVTVPANQPIPEAGTNVEVRYLYAFKGGSLYQPVLLGARDDVTIRDCGIEQLKYKNEEE